MPPNWRSDITDNAEGSGAPLRRAIVLRFAGALGTHDDKARERRKHRTTAVDTARKEGLMATRSIIVDVDDELT